MMRVRQRYISALQQPWKALAKLHRPEFHPIVTWKAPGEGLLIGLGRALSVAADFDTWQNTFADSYTRLRAACDTDECAEHLRVLFSVFFDPGRPGDAWNEFESVDVFVPAILYRETEAGASVTFFAEEAALDELEEIWRMLADSDKHSSGSNPSTQIMADGPATADSVSGNNWNDSTYMRVVENGLDLLQETELEKIVLAREERIDTPRPTDVFTLAGILSSEYPEGYVYLNAPVPGVSFISATPEQLARVKDGVLHTVAVAGTMPRGQTPQEDRSLGDALTASVKNRAEHAHVVEMLLNETRDLCSDINVEPTGLLKLKYVQHLVTPITGTLMEGSGLADVVCRLHPTPAVCGTPRDAALKSIRQLEGFSRGLFAGAAGWMDLFGNGEAAVMIRSALFHNTQVRIFAGAGIVSESNPAEEAQETRLKMNAILGALGKVRHD